MIFSTNIRKIKTLKIHNLGIVLTVKQINLDRSEITVVTSFLNIALNLKYELIV